MFHPAPFLVFSRQTQCIIARVASFDQKNNAIFFDIGKKEQHKRYTVFSNTCRGRFALDRCIFVNANTIYLNYISILLEFSAFRKKYL